MVAVIFEVLLRAREEFEGRLFRIYTKSHFLDYVARGPLATKLAPGPFRHYGLFCCNHVIDVASSSEPVIKQIRSVNAGWNKWSDP